MMAITELRLLNRRRMLHSPNIVNGRRLVKWPLRLSHHTYVIIGLLLFAHFLSPHQVMTGHKWPISAARNMVGLLGLHPDWLLDLECGHLKLLLGYCSALFRHSGLAFASGAQPRIRQHFSAHQDLAIGLVLLRNSLVWLVLWQLRK